MFKYLLLLGGTVFVLIRGTLFLISKLSQGNLINQIKKNPEKATAYIEHLDIPYGKWDNINTSAYQMMISKIQASPMIGKYKILYSLIVDDREFLVFTELSFIDFDVTVTGHSSDVKKTVFHNLLFVTIQKQRIYRYYPNCIIAIQKNFSETNFFHRSWPALLQHNSISYKSFAIINFI
jgi:hypothetical protein